MRKGKKAKQLGCSKLLNIEHYTLTNEMRKVKKHHERVREKDKKNRNIYDM